MKRKGRARSWARHIVLRGLLGTILLFATWSGWLYATAPVDALRGRWRYVAPYSQTSREAGLGVPHNLTIEEMPESMIFATLYGEDIEFATDHGIRPQKIFRNLRAYWENGGHLSGGSTITQQVVKNAFTGTHRTLYRKYVEMIYALRMERDFSKEEIFTLYANMAEVAPGVYGYRQAAQLYFQKEPLALSDAEAVFIVNNLPSPEKRSAWFRQGTSDETAFERTFALLANTRLLMDQYDATHLEDETKRSLFTVYMRESSLPEDSPRERAVRLIARSRVDAAAFVLSHWHGNADDVGVPAFDRRQKMRR